MSFGVIVAGTDRGAYVHAAQDPIARYMMQMGARGSADITFRVPPGDTSMGGQPFLPAVGNAVDLFEGGTRVFAGSVDKIEQQWWGQDGWYYVKCTLVTTEQRLDKRLISPRRYTGMTCGAIVTALINEFGPPEAITAGIIQDGPTIDTDVVYDQDVLTDAINRLATTANFIWGIDPTNLTLYFMARGTVSAPFSMGITDLLWETLDLQTNRQDFRDRQKIRISFNAFSPENNIFAGNGVSTTATLRKIAQEVIAASLTTGLQATATGTFTGIPSDGDTATIDAYRYTFVTTLDNTDPFLVKIGGSAAATCQNFVDAVNASLATGGSGYSLPTFAQASTMADAPSGASFVLRSRQPGAFWNTIVLASASAAFSWNHSTLQGGTDDTMAVGLSFGVLGVDTGKDVFYTRGSADLVLANPVPTGQYLSVSFRPLGGDILAVEDSALVAARAAVESSSGLYENLAAATEVSNPVSTDPLAAIQQINGTLIAYKQLPQTVSVTTYHPGLQVGQLLTISFPPPFDSVSAEWLIQQIDAEYQEQLTHWKYTAQCLAVVRIPTWLAFWEKLALIGGGQTSAAALKPPGSTGRIKRATFIFGGGGVTGPFIAVNALTNRVMVGDDEGGSPLYWEAWVDEASAGADVHFDLLQNGVSILQTPIVVPAGSLTLQRGTDFGTGSPATTITFVPGDSQQGKVLQVGSTSPGRSGTVRLFWQ